MSLESDIATVEWAERIIVQIGKEGLIHVFSQQSKVKCCTYFDPKPGIRLLLVVTFESVKGAVTRRILVLNTREQFTAGKLKCDLRGALRGSDKMLDLGPIARTYKPLAKNYKALETEWALAAQYFKQVSGQVRELWKRIQTYHMGYMGS